MPSQSEILHHALLKGAILSVPSVASGLGQTEVSGVLCGSGPGQVFGSNMTSSVTHCSILEGGWACRP